MRKWMFIASVLCLQTVEAQRLYSEVGDIYEKSKRTVVDNAKLGAFYELGLLLITLNLELSMN